MKNKGRGTVSLVLALSLSLGMIPPAAAASTSVHAHWAQETAQQFFEKGYLYGDGHGNYLLDEGMSRVQFAVMLNRIMGYTDESGDIANYADVAEDAWYRADLAKALAAGYMTGTSPSTMSPDQPISREQAFTMIAKALKLEVAQEEQTPHFVDQDQISSYAVDAILALAQKGYIAGNPNGELMPQKTITRGEGIAALSQAEQAKGEQKPEVEESPYKDGVYVGRAVGFGGTIKLQVTVQKGKLTDITVLSHSETPAYFRRVQQLFDKIIEKQDIQGVDTISGATISSQGILNAIGACISQAKGGPDTSKEGAIGGGGGGDGDATPPIKTDFGLLEDGAYSGGAAGYSGITKVDVIVYKEHVNEINVLSHGDDVEYFNDARAVIDRMIEKQSTDVDVVSGATYSSYGIINAVADALKLDSKDNFPLQFDATKPLTDGEWYGTAGEGRNYEQSEPSVVKVTVADGAIQKIESVKYTDDYGFYSDRRDKLLAMITSPEIFAAAAKQISQREGEHYDTIAQATLTARGHIRAIDHALARSARYESDKVDQQVAWIEMEQRPDQTYFGRPLDLSKSIVKVHYMDHRTEHIPFDQFEAQGITTNWAHGTVIDKDTDGVDHGTSITIDFKHELSGAHTHTRIPVTEYKEVKYPTHISVQYKSQPEVKIDLDPNHFRYDLKPTDEIAAMSLYNGDAKLVDGRYNPYTQSWFFSLQDVPAGDGAQWGFYDYRVDLDGIIDNSKIVSFTVNKQQTDYLVGDTLKLDDISITITTENQNIIELKTKEECEARGFKMALPDKYQDGYVFKDDDVGSVQLTISNDSVDAPQIITLKVEAVEVEAPARVEVFDWFNTDITEEEVAKLMAGQTAAKTIKLEKSKEEEWKKTYESLWPYVFNQDDSTMDYEVEIVSEKQFVITFPDYDTLPGKLELNFTFEP